MAMIETIADGIAKQAMEAIARTGDEELEAKIKAEIGASSPTLEEAFATAMRIRKAEKRALDMLEKFNRGEKVEMLKITSQPQGDMSH